MIAAWSRSLPRKRKISLRTDAASFREDATQEVNTGAGFLNCGLQKLWIFCTAVLKFICFFFVAVLNTAVKMTSPCGLQDIYTRSYLLMLHCTEGYHLNKPQALMRLSSCTLAWSSCVLVVRGVSDAVHMTDACSTVQQCVVLWCGRIDKHMSGTATSNHANLTALSSLWLQLDFGYKCT